MPQLHNAIARAGDLLRGFRRAVGLIDADAEGVSRLGETLTPVLDIFGRPEFSVLRGELLGWGAIAVAALAGNRSQVTLRNPTGSGRIITLDLMEAGLTGGVAIAIGFSTTEYATVGSSRGARDGRITVPLVGELRSQQAAAEGVVRFVGHMVAGQESFVFPGPVIIAPGTGLMVRPDSDNNALEVSFLWRERTMLPGETIDNLRGG